MLSEQQGATAEHSRKQRRLPLYCLPLYCLPGKQHRLIGFQFLAGPRPPAPHAGRRPRGRRQAARQRGDERQLGVLRERGGGGGAARGILPTELLSISYALRAWEIETHFSVGSKKSRTPPTLE